ncbi:MAG: hypothetical protein HND52_05630 [Ignavibacteriae bacterium]|nr:hypothetical protein [Ignavibacteriota bacterium]NOG97432.1 hypothetical protein [Ignavibacteriota bacterium]
MFSKRVFASLIDLVMASLPVIVVFSSEGLIKYIPLLSFLFYLIHTTVFLLINKKHTIGEKLMRIQVVFSKDFSNIKVHLRNLLFAILIFAPVISYNSISELIFMYIPLLCLFPFTDEKESGEKINGLDLLFKNQYRGE